MFENEVSSRIIWDYINFISLHCINLSSGLAYPIKIKLDNNFVVIPPVLNDKVKIVMRYNSANLDY